MSVVSGFPVILSAPSGSGKTTIAKLLLARRPDLGYSVSCTTRSARPGEIPGTDYYFISRAEFIAERERDAFAESAVVHGNLYGTLRREVERVMADGKHVVMDIDVQGANQFMRAFPQSVTIFILPPSAEVLLDRLRRLVAIDLKLGKFQAADKGQMELYLRWLEKYDMQPGEEAPIGLILCADKGEEHVELLQLDRSGIRVAQYLSELPPLELLEKKLHESIRLARERLAQHTDAVPPTGLLPDIPTTKPRKAQPRKRDETKPRR